MHFADKIESKHLAFAMKKTKMDVTIAIGSFLFNQNDYTRQEEGKRKMAENMPKEKVQELKEMIQEKKPDEPIDKVLVNFCSRHAVSMKTCKKYYDRMVEKGEVKKE